jgi:acyl-CoA hydrolase
MPQRIRADQVPALLEPGMTVYLSTCAGESLLFAAALRASPGSARGVRFVGVSIPGVNTFDYASLDPAARATAFFVTPAMRESFAAGKIDFLPLHYSDITLHLRSLDYDLGLFQVSPPDAAGDCSFGLAADFPPSLIDRCRVKLAHVNPRLPAPPGAPKVAFSDFDLIVEEAHDVLTYDIGGDNPALAQLGAHIATLIGDGDTIQIGLGKIQAAVLDPLHDRRNLRLHGGMVSDPLVGLAQAGALAKRTQGRPPPVVTGVALGREELYDFVASTPDVQFRPASHTHDLGVLGAIPKLIAINSAIEVDLLGQANAEMIDGRQVSGVGGLMDFLRGARRSPGGRAILALVSATSDGKKSRIVPGFAPGTTVTAPRNDVDFVVTEHGIADLRGKAVPARAEALIEVAAPQFRSELATAWAERTTRRTK